MNRQRMDAENCAIPCWRVAGDLNLKKGGPSVVPPLTKEEKAGMWAPSQWPVSLDPAEHNRRSVYLYVKRSFRMPMLESFDVPETSLSCPRRDVTTVAPQALALLNSEFSLRAGEGVRRASLQKRHPANDRTPGFEAHGDGARPDPAPTEKEKALEFLASPGAALTRAVPTSSLRVDAALSGALQHERVSCTWTDMRGHHAQYDSLRACALRAGSFWKHGLGLRHAGAGLPAGTRRPCGAGRADGLPRIRLPPRRRTFRPRPSTSFSCSCTADPATWTRSIRSPRWRSSTASHAAQLRQGLLQFTKVSEAPLLASRRDVQEVRAVRYRNFRPVSERGAACRRPGGDPLLLSRRLHAFHRAELDEQRLAATGPAQRGFLGGLRPRQRERQLCRRSW